MRLPASCASAAALRGAALVLIVAAAAVSADQNLPPPPEPSPEVQAQAQTVRDLENARDYAGAVDALRKLRGMVPIDADVEIELALNEARTGEIDSAAARLSTPLLDAAIVDTLSTLRRAEYLNKRTPLWVNGLFDGWYWYVARARAEVYAMLGRWDEALEAARVCTDARPLAGKEWVIRAICAMHAGHPDEGADAARRAVYLDPSLPEAHYVAGLYAWRAGKRDEAAAQCARAVALDSTYSAAVVAEARALLPFGNPPDFPIGFLTGPREIGLLTSPAGPKFEDHEQTDTPVSADQFTDVVIPDSLHWKPMGALLLPVLIGPRGRIVLNALPWFSPTLMPAEAVHLTCAAMPAWAFRPATRFGVPKSAWSTLRVRFLNPDSTLVAAPPDGPR